MHSKYKRQSSQLNKKKFISGCILTIVVIMAAAGIGQMLSYAVFDPDSATHIKANEIEDSTLIIGTHLIHLSALNDQIYNLAMESASDSTQSQIYYKSELANGAWIDITDAGSVKAIESEATPVEDSVIEALYVRYHTKSDKITYDLMNGEATNIYDLIDVYDLELMEELQPLKMQYDILKSKEGKTPSDKYNEEKVRDFFKINVQDEVTAECDTQLAGLQSYYEELASAGVDSQSLDMITKCMEAVNGKRKAYICVKLADPHMNALMRILQGIEEDADKPKEYEVDSNLAAGASDSLQNLQDSVIEAQAVMLAEGSSIISKEQYTQYNNLIIGATVSNVAQCDDAIDRLIYLDNINNSAIQEKENELNYITNELLVYADNSYQAATSSGVSGEYQAKATNANVSRAILKQLLKQQLNDTNTIRLEMQFIIEAKTQRMEIEAAKQFIDQRLLAVESLKSAVKEDEYKYNADLSIDDYRIWLEETLDNLNRAMGTDEINTLEQQKKDYQLEQQKAYDDNDLAGAKKYDNLLVNVDAKIKEAGGGNANAIDAAKENAIQAIKDGDLETAKNNLNAIGAIAGMNPNAAVNATQQIQNTISGLLDSRQTGNGGGGGGDGGGNGSGGNGGGDGSSGDAGTGDGGGDIAATKETKALTELSDAANELIADNANALISGLSKDAIMGLLNQLLEGGFENTDSKSQGAAIIAVHNYALFVNKTEIMDLAASLADIAYQAGNPYLYFQYKDRNTEYVSTKAIGTCLGYRYIYNNSQKQVTLSKKGIYYVYRAFSKEIEENETLTEMDKEAGFKQVIYLDEDYTKNIYQCYSYYIIHSEYGILTTEEMEQKADEIYQELLAATVE